MRENITYGSFFKVVISIVVMSLILSQCAPSTTYRAEQLLDLKEGFSRRWVNYKELKDLGSVNWISSLGGSDLKKLVERACSHSPSMQEMKYNLRKAQILERAAGVQRKPIVEFKLNGDRQKAVVFESPFTTATYNTLQQGVSTTWELDLWGKVKNQANATRLEVLAQNYLLKSMRASLAGEVAKLWGMMAEKKSQITFAQQLLDLEKKVKEVSESRFKFYRKVDQIEGDALTEANQHLGGLKNEYSRLNSQLNILIGTYAVDIESIPSAIPLMKGGVPQGISSRELLKRPDILAAEHKYWVSVMNEKAAYAALYPSFSLTGLMGIGTNKLKEILNSKFGVWQLGAGITIPLLNRGLLKSEIELKKAESDTSLYKLHEVMLKAFNEVDITLENERSINSQIGELESACKRGLKSFLSIDKKYMRGKSSLEEYYIAHRQLIILKSQIESLKLQKFLNRINLYLALGGGF